MICLVSMCIYIDGPAVMNRVDGAAEVLGVHVRRIYELIKILEILSLVAVRILHYSIRRNQLCSFVSTYMHE